jgi:acyl carrier protein
MLVDVIGPEYLIGLDIELETSFDADLELESLEFVAMAERLLQHYGEQVDFVAWLATMELDEIIGLTVGDLVTFIDTSTAGTTTATPAAATVVTATEPRPETPGTTATGTTAAADTATGTTAAADEATVPGTTHDGTAAAGATAAGTMGAADTAAGTTVTGDTDDGGTAAGGWGEGAGADDEAEDLIVSAAVGASADAGTLFDAQLDEIEGADATEGGAASSWAVG